MAAYKELERTGQAEDEASIAPAKQMRRSCEVAIRLWRTRAESRPAFAACPLKTTDILLRATHRAYRFRPFAFTEAEGLCALLPFNTPLPYTCSMQQMQHAATKPPDDTVESGE